MVRSSGTLSSSSVAATRQLLLRTRLRCYSGSTSINSAVRSPRYPKLHDTQTTQYTISDEVCPPSDPKVLHRLVSRNWKSFEKWKENKPVASHTAQAFETAKEFIALHGNKPVVLDSGCGTGRSTWILGEKYPDHIVIGVDRSLARLSKQSQHSRNEANNVLLLQAELVDFWRCLATCTIVDHHYLLYPNPYPKSSLLNQRWYGHSSFPLLLQMSGTSIIVRSNWKVYLKEFAQAVKVVEDCSDDNEKWSVAEPTTLVAPDKQQSFLMSRTNFEEKYRRAGEPTYELTCLRNNKTTERQA